MKLNTKEQKLRDQLGLIIPYTKEELKLLSKIDVEYVENTSTIIVRVI